ncbi:MAG: hypothetical protein J6N15_01925 [Ruminiclostridium sp.]|nr:hypothetical protein [Ruminiclostridium sp.]
MEINNLQFNSISQYKKLSKPVSSKKSEASAKGRTNTDKVEFDFGRSLTAAKAGAAARANAPASEERLAELAAKYAGDNCPVSAEAVAAAIVA